MSSVRREQIVQDILDERKRNAKKEWKQLSFRKKLSFIGERIAESVLSIFTISIMLIMILAEIFFFLAIFVGIPTLILLGILALLGVL